MFLKDRILWKLVFDRHIVFILGAENIASVWNGQYQCDTSTTIFKLSITQSRSSMRLQGLLEVNNQVTSFTGTFASYLKSLALKSDMTNMEINGVFSTPLSLQGVIMWDNGMATKKLCSLTMSRADGMYSHGSVSNK